MLDLFGVTTHLIYHTLTNVNFFSELKCPFNLFCADVFDNYYSNSKQKSISSVCLVLIILSILYLFFEILNLNEIIITSYNPEGKRPFLQLSQDLKQIIYYIDWNKKL